LAAAAVYGGPGSTFMISSGNIFVKTPFIGKQDAVWKAWGGVTGQGPDTSNPMMFVPAFGIGLNVVPSK